MRAHRDLIEETERTVRLARAQRQAIDELLIEFSRLERQAVAAIAARRQREHVGRWIHASAPRGMQPMSHQGEWSWEQMTYSTRHITAGALRLEPAGVQAR